MSEPDEVRRWLVRGVVQGVGFRLYVAREANRLELRGTVRNTREGAVDVVATGPAEALDQLLERLYRGPDGARVESVKPISVDGVPVEFPRTFVIVS